MQTVKKPVEHPNFDTVWAVLQEVGEKQKETDRQIKKTERMIDRNARQMDEYNKRFGDFTRRFGEVVEYMIAPNLCEKFREFDLIFQRSNSGTRVNDHKNRIHFEVDVILENSDKAMLVEVKTKLTMDDVNGHIARLGKMRNYADLHGDKRSFLGAVAGVVIASNVKDYALGQGLFVVEPSGESFNITPPDNKPKEW